MKNEQLSGLGKIYKLDPKIFTVMPGFDNDTVAHYLCDTCYKTTNVNLRDVCPTYRCAGRLHEVNLDEKLRDNHYRKLYRNIKPENMKSSEHTAQLTTEYAAEVQSQFINGEVNVLSCSTTFELGVDVGELETVFMKNMPPTPANYAQRAGRAGRRTDSTAYALTYARLASHDFSSFKEPGKMISGVVKPPYFETANEKIALRHLYACAFSYFWRLYPNYFKSVDDFFNKSPKGPDLFREYLNSRPQDLFKMLQEVTPDLIKESIELEDWGWVEKLYGENGVMTKVTFELESDLENLQEALRTAVENEQYSRANVLKRVRNTIMNRPLINYFSQKNLIPKYGFPVDVVALEINSHTEEAKNIDLSRDLQIAISEYAPGGQVVANGKLWTSQYVKRVANRELIRYRYTQCRCGYFRRIMELEPQEKTVCPSCGNPNPVTGTYIMPEFGFISDSSASDPGDRKPERTYSGRKHFSGVGKNYEEKYISVGSHTLSINAQEHGELAVINNGKGNGFYICKFCGYGMIGKTPGSHRNPHGSTCNGKFERVALGYDLETDILEIDFMNIFKEIQMADGFWESIMYSLIEGMSAALEIDRTDIDGTLYLNHQMNRSVILFDTVPGGAGHVKRMLHQENFIMALQEALKIVSGCTCGADKMDTSCYSCLRNYYNQYCHDDLRRDLAIEALNYLIERK